VLIGRAVERHRRRRWQALTRLAHHFLDVVQGLPTLKVFGRAAAQVASLERVTDAYRVETMASLRIAFLSAFALEFFATLSVALVAVGIGIRLVEGSLDLRTGLFVLILAPEAYLPLRQLGLHFHASEEGRSAMRAAFELIDTPLPGAARLPAEPLPAEPLPATLPDLRTATLRVDGVTVRSPGRGLLAPDGASFAIRAGEIVALTGANGAGKSTLLAAILGLVGIDGGAIVLVGEDGAATPIADLDPGLWRRRLAWVPQTPFLAAGTLADNVRLVAPGASDAAIRDALDAVGLDRLDPSLELGEGGLGLSSGERRRVAVARALARDPAVVLVDEPTAGLDDETEQVVLAAIERRARDARSMVVLVAHRPAAIAVADREVRLSARVDPEALDGPAAA
ncbi:MAG TPA: ATP-binding cassette domain-containing protein, partial [Solirubrobacteraceae bacterium]|nr:ATP-binding cassette domain-containing protein [Solirubrobacteraceae bacterium]